MMLLIECSNSGYDLIAESTSREYLENLRRFEEGFNFQHDVDQLHAFATCAENTEHYEFPECGLDNEGPNMFEDTSELLIVPRSVIGRRGDMSTMEALQEKFPLPSMLRERLSQLNQL